MNLERGREPARWLVRHQALIRNGQAPKLNRVHVFLKRGDYSIQRNARDILGIRNCPNVEFSNYDSVRLTSKLRYDKIEGTALATAELTKQRYTMSVDDYFPCYASGDAMMLKQVAFAACERTFASG